MKIPHKPYTRVDFSDCPCLINKQYQYKTLGEMVAMYHKTGEFPAVGTRNGVYFARSIDDEIPPTDRFDVAQSLLDKSREINDAEQKLNDELSAASKKERDDLLSQIESLKQQLDSQNPPVAE